MSNGIEVSHKVAFILDVGTGWMGGVNYYKNLLSAVEQYGKGQFSFCIIVSDDADLSIFDGYPSSVQLVQSSMLQRWTMPWFFRKIFQKLIGKDLVLSQYLKSKEIEIISHYSDLCPNIKMTTWIPDFQHKHCKSFFSKEEILSRDKGMEEQSKKADVVILSSEAAKVDFLHYYPQYAEKAQVLQFVPTLTYQRQPSKDVLQKYGIEGKFFFLPNQYWKHKNHKRVLEALAILKKKGHSILVISTGATEDYRNPAYMDEIRALLDKEQLADRYKILGLVPYEDVQALASLCHAYINPSYFEGWSTSVEEAKYNGKRIVLSGLVIHREQAPKYGVYFDPDNAEELADKLLEVWNMEQPKESIEDLMAYNEDMKRKFAQRYEEILTELVEV